MCYMGGKGWGGNISVYEKTETSQDNIVACF